MRKPFVLSLTVLAFLGASAFSRADDASPEPYANINAGNFRAFGSFLYETNSNGHGNIFELNPGVDYFVKDRLAIGWSFSIEAGSGFDTIAGLGPEVQYEFWQKDQVATYVRSGIQFGVTDATTREEVLGEVGAQYFLTPSVDIGPYMRYTYFFSHFQNWDRFDFGAFLGIYL